MACSDPEFNFWKLSIYFRTFGRTPWKGDRPDSRPLPTQDNITQKNADTQCLEWDSNPRSQCSIGRRQCMPHSRITDIINVSLTTKLHSRCSHWT